MLGYMAAIAAVVMVTYWYRRWKWAQRERYIRAYAFPPSVMQKLGKKYPSLGDLQLGLVAQGLRQFFLAYAQSGKFVSMPSQVADDLWHEFIIHTKAYQAFCRNAFGRFMHHTPAVALGKQQQNNNGLRRTWAYSCRQENINPDKPSRLPLLFALDAQLGIANGFVYHPECRKLHEAAGGAAVYCGGDLGSGSFDSGSDGTGDSSASGSDSDSGSSSGDSGSGCGGGCGGGDD